MPQEPTISGSSPWYQAVVYQTPVVPRSTGWAITCGSCPGSGARLNYCADTDPPVSTRVRQVTTV